MEFCHLHIGECPELAPIDDRCFHLLVSIFLTVPTFYAHTSAYHVIAAYMIVKKLWMSLSFVYSPVLHTHTSFMGNLSVRPVIFFFFSFGIRDETHNLCLPSKRLCPWAKPLAPFIFGNGSYHISQAGPKFLSSGDSPASACQIVGTTDMYHHICSCACYVLYPMKSLTIDCRVNDHCWHFFHKLVTLWRS